MEKLQFKTSIKCTGCIEKVSPYLNRVAGEKNWEVNLEHPDRILTIPDSENLKASEVVDALNQAGYKAEKI